MISKAWKSYPCFSCSESPRGWTFSLNFQCKTPTTIQNLLFIFTICYGFARSDVDSGELGLLLRFGTFLNKNSIKAIGALSEKKK